jgi:mannosyltransferase
MALKTSRTLLICAVVLIAVGVLLPRDWYDAVPPTRNVPNPPISGVTLVQIMFVLEGLALLVLALRPRRPAPASPEPGVRIAQRADRPDPLSERTAVLCLAAITALALGLRLYHAGSDLWIDELATVQTARTLSALHIVASYINSGNHLLNTLLVKACMALFGRSEWAIRLPAILFGAAAVPAFYWACRIGFSRMVSLAAALLLAVSYHHIFFSQNARGYTAYLFFAVLSSGMLVRALERNTLRWWGAYVACMVLGFSFLLHTMFVALGHVLTAGIAIWLHGRRGGATGSLVGRAVSAYAIVAVLALHIYALVLPKVYMYITTTYRGAESGYSLLSLGFVAEVLQGLAAGIPYGVVVLPIGGIVVAAGILLTFRRHWLLAAALLAPSLVAAAFIALNQLSASPRIFLMAIFPGLLGGVLVLEWLLGRIPAAKSPAIHARAFAAVILILTAASLVPMRRYYATAKQPFRASLAYLQSERRPGDMVVAVYLSDTGYQYYGSDFGLDETNTAYVRSQEAFDRVLAEHPRDKLWIVTSLHRILAIAYPDLVRELRAEWNPVRVFPATIAGGEITVWRPR